MLRQSPSRSNKSKKLRPRRSFQALLLFAVGIWIVYQLTRSYGKRRGAVVVETDADSATDGREPATRRQLGRKGFVGHASDDVGAGWDTASFDGSLSKPEDRDGQDEDQEADEVDAAEDADDGLAGDDEEDDDRDLLLSPNDDAEDEMDILLVNGGTSLNDHEPKELNGSAVQRAKATVRVQDAAANQQTNATDGAGAAEGRASATAMPLGDNPLKNGSSVNLSLHDRGSAGDAATAEKLAANGSVGADNEKHTLPVEDNRRMTIRKEAAYAVAEQGLSS